MTDSTKNIKNIKNFPNIFNKNVLIYTHMHPTGMHTCTHACMHKQTPLKKVQYTQGTISMANMIYTNSFTFGHIIRQTRGIHIYIWIRNAPIHANLISTFIVPFCLFKTNLKKEYTVNRKTTSM